jgi:hypothetical protein
VQVCPEISSARLQQLGQLVLLPLGLRPELRPELRPALQQTLQLRPGLRSELRPTLRPGLWPLVAPAARLVLERSQGRRPPLRWETAAGEDDGMVQPCNPS